MTRSTSFIQGNKEREKQGRHPSGGGGSTTLFIDNIIICVENAQNI